MQVGKRLNDSAKFPVFQKGCKRRIAGDIVDHFEQRLEVLEGKAMVVCMSRRICVDLYNELVRLRPDWQDDADAGGSIKVVMTGSASDPPEWQQHVRNKTRREALANRFRDVEDPFSIVLVRDMWLTGFDAPSLHTMYLDKPMRGHGLMQAIARVNRVFKDKPGGLVVDYLGLANDLRQALVTYTESGGTGRAAIDKEEAVAVMQEKYDVCCALFHGFDWSRWTTGTLQERLGLLPAAQEHILAQESGKERCMAAVRELSQSFALAVPHAETFPHPRRCRVLPGGAGGIIQAGSGRLTPGRRLGFSDTADSFPISSLGRRNGHLRSGRVGQARYIGAVRRVSGGSTGDSPAQPGGGAAVKVAPGRSGHPPPDQCSSGPVFRRDAGADSAPLLEPGD